MDEHFSERLAAAGSLVEFEVRRARGTIRLFLLLVLAVAIGWGVLVAIGVD